MTPEPIITQNGGRCHCGLWPLVAMHVILASNTNYNLSLVYAVSYRYPEIGNGNGSGNGAGAGAHGFRSEGWMVLFYVMA